MLKFIILLITCLFLISYKQQQELFKLNDDMKIKKVTNDIIVIDNFYKNPDILRKIYLNKNYQTHYSIYDTEFYNPNLFFNFKLIKFFEKIIRTKINYLDWINNINNNSNGFFQYLTKFGQPTIHSDEGTCHAAVIFLGDNLHPNTGTSFYKHKESNLEITISDYEFKKLSKQNQTKYLNYSKNDFWLQGEKAKFDKWEKIYQIKNKFNRAIVFNSKRFHSSDGGYGDNKFNSRFFQTFFF